MAMPVTALPMAPTISRGGNTRPPKVPAAATTPATSLTAYPIILPVFLREAGLVVILKLLVFLTL